MVILLKNQNTMFHIKCLFYLYTTQVYFSIQLCPVALVEIVKGFYLFKFVKSSQRTKALSTIIVDRIIGLLCTANNNIILTSFTMGKN